MTAPGVSTGSAVTARIDVDRGPDFRLRADFALEAGEKLAIMGPSGAGKSTLLRALAGFVTLDGGGIRIGHREVAAGGTRRVHVPPAARGTILLGQDPRLFPHLTARENVAFGPRAHGVAAASARALADEWLARVDLADMGDRRPAALSGGQQQRVALARALAVQPDLVLLDEPLTSLDPETAAEVRRVLVEQLVGTAIIVTHDAVDAVALATRLAVLEQGDVVQEGFVRDVFAAPATDFVASLAGLVRVEGHVAAGIWSAGELRLACERPDGPAAAVFSPSAVEIAPARAVRDGCWEASVRRLEQTVAGVRVHTEHPRIACDVSVDAVAAHAIAPGVTLALSMSPRGVRFVEARAS